MERKSEDGSLDNCEKGGIRGTSGHNQRVTYGLVVPNQRGDCILGQLLPNGTLRLPRVQMITAPEREVYEDEEELLIYIDAQWDVMAHVAESVFGEFNNRTSAESEDEPYKLAFADTCGQQPKIKSPLEWVRRDVACGSKWEDEHDNEINDAIRRQIERVFGEINRERPVGHDEAWKFAGWKGRVTCWVREVLRERNMVLEGLLDDFSQNEFGRVLMATMRERDVKKRKVESRTEGHESSQWRSEEIFVKGSARSVREGERTTTVSQVIGNIVPEVLGFNEMEGVMIQRDGGRIMEEPFDQEALINTILKMQTMSIERVSELKAGGVIVVDSAWLEVNIEKILNHKLVDDCCAYFDEEYGEDALTRLIQDARSKLGAFQRVCRKISDLGLPSTLVHGDLCIQNIGSPLPGEQKLYRIFDWATCFIGNPLYDFAGLLVPRTEAPEYSFDCEAGMRQVCEFWIPGLTEEEMKSTFELILRSEAWVWTYQLCKQYEAYDESQTEARFYIIKLAESCIDHLRAPVER